MRALFLCALLGASLVLGACVQRYTPEIFTPAPQETAQAVWDTFTTYSAERAAEAGPSRLQAALRYSDTKGDGWSASAIFWSNGDVPLRLEALAMGDPVARIRQSESHLLVHSPRENKAWVNGGEGTLSLLNMPFTTDIRDLYALTEGRYLVPFGPAVTGHSPIFVGENIRYTLGTSPWKGTVVLSPAGLLLHWLETPGGWSLDIEYEGVPPLPKTLILDHPHERNVKITVTKREHSLPPFSEKQLDLILPAGTIIERIRG